MIIIIFYIDKTSRVILKIIKNLKKFLKFYSLIKISQGFTKIDLEILPLSVGERGILGLS